MEHSIEFRRELKKLNVEASMLAFADLMAVGYKDVDAFKLCYPEYMQYPEKQQTTIKEKIINSAKFRKLLDARKSRVKENAIPVDLEDVELIEGDEVAREILRSAKSAPIGSKERADLFMRYDEIRQRNIVEPEQDETDSINFYLPLKCSMCPFYARFNEMLYDDVGKEIRPLEMDSIIRKAVKKAYPDAVEAYNALHCNSYKSDMKNVNR